MKTRLGCKRELLEDRPSTFQGFRAGGFLFKVFEKFVSLEKIIFFLILIVFVIG